MIIIWIKALLKGQRHHCYACVSAQLISSVVTHSWCDIVQSCELESWKEALAALLTYADPEEFARLCGENSTGLVHTDCPNLLTTDLVLSWPCEQHKPRGVCGAKSDPGQMFCSVNGHVGF